MSVTSSGQDSPPFWSGALYAVPRTDTTFRSILAGNSRLGRLNRDWAAVRLLELAPYPEIIRFLGFPALVRGWPAWRDHVRSQSRRRGFDFLVDWLPRTHPELL